MFKSFMFIEGEFDRSDLLPEGLGQYSGAIITSTGGEITFNYEEAEHFVKAWDFEITPDWQASNNQDNS